MSCVISLCLPRARVASLRELCRSDGIMQLSPLR
jgi:hypothetical protein